jgi:hypothetical protein
MVLFATALVLFSYKIGCFFYLFSLSGENGYQGRKKPPELDGPVVHSYPTGD